MAIVLLNEESLEGRLLCFFKKKFKKIFPP